MAEVQLYKRGTGNNVIQGVDGTADSARFVSIGLGVASPASGLQIEGAAIEMADGPGTAAYLQMEEGQSAAVSGTDIGRIRYNSATNQWEASESGGAFAAFVTGAGALGGWTDDGAIVRLSTTGDTVAIGDTAMAGGEKVRIVGALRVEGAIAQIGGAAQVSFAGNVDAANGLDVTTEALTAAAALSVTGGALTFTGSNIDLDPTGTFALDMDDSGTVTITVADNLGSAFLIQQGALPYFDLTTTDGTEDCGFGNTTTNPTYSFLGSGEVIIDGDALTFTEQAGDPGATANTGKVYTKEDGGSGVTELFFQASDGTVSQLTPISGGTPVDTYRWVINGKPSVQADIDNAWIVPRDGTITRITLYRKTAGSSGSTIVDVNLNGTTVYTTQGNRPTVTQAGGDDQIDATTDMDVTAVSQDDRLQVDVDVVEAGNPQDISVMVEIEYT